MSRVTEEGTRAALRETPSQTAGPYVHIGLVPRVAGLDPHPRQLGDDVAGPHARGTRIRIEGRVLDGAGEPLGDALLEVWQANADGHHAHPDGGAPVEPGFRGWGRVVPDADTGRWRLDTVKPGPTSGPDGAVQAPHLVLWIVARGINLGLSTRLYFDDESEANDRDPVLRLVEPAARRTTLVATRESGDGTDDPRPRYRFDIRLQGEDETVFLDA